MKSTTYGVLVVATIASVPASLSRAAEPAARSVIATAEESKGRLRAELTELERASGGTVNLKFTLINDSDTAVNAGEFVAVSGSLVDANSEYTVGGVHLIDPVGKKKYFVARDSQGKCACSVFGLLPKRGRANHWAKLAAPPDDVDRLSVILPGFSPMDDVPLSR